MPLAAAMSATALTAAAAVSDSGGNSGGPCDDGGCTSNSSTGGAPPLKDAVFERSTPGSAWASSQQPVAHLTTRAQAMCVTGGTASSNGYHILGGVCKCPAAVERCQPPVGFEPTTSRLLSGCSAS